MMSFSEAVKTCLKKYFSVHGRATRAEYWWFQLFIWLTFGCLIVLSCSLGEFGQKVLLPVSMFFYIAMIIPSFCCRIRRLHDTGSSAWFLLINLIPYIGGFILFITMLEGSEKRTNKYGPYLYDTGSSPAEQKPDYADYEEVEETDDTTNKTKEEITDVEL